MIIFLQGPSFATFLLLSLQMSFCYRKQRGGKENAKRGEGEGMGEVGRINVEIAVNNKLEMDFDWLL